MQTPQAYITHKMQQQPADKDKGMLQKLSRQAGKNFLQMGIPTTRHEEWRYTRMGPLFGKEYEFQIYTHLTEEEIKPLHLPGSEQAHELFFVNGRYAPTLSRIRSKSLRIMPLQQAAENENSTIIATQLGHSAQYLHDGIHALNACSVETGSFIQLEADPLSHPIYIYCITDARATNVFAQPRILIHLPANQKAVITTTYHTLGANESFTNEVTEIAVEEGAQLEYYKIQNDAAHSNQVSTTHIRQLGQSLVHTLCLSLSGATIRNNLQVVLEAEQSEAHLYGLYFTKGNTHTDHHTVVDHAKPHCFSNELYKGLLDGNSTGVFNGKILVRKDAQKTNAYQTNKNILLSETASVNSKPQLEIYADDVKCSHGCTVGRLNEDALFYMQSRGIPQHKAQALLVQAFAADLLEQIKLPVLRNHAANLIAQILSIDAHHV